MSHNPQLAEWWVETHPAAVKPRRAVERNGILYAQFSDGLYQRRLHPLEFWQPVPSVRADEVRELLGIHQTP